MVTLISYSPAETQALGESWGRAAEPGLVIGLSGDLGTGKTQIVKGLARGLGIEQHVHSPTFSLVNIYTGGRLTLWHLDLYRLDRREQIIAAGLEEFLGSDGVTVIEWAERWFPDNQWPTGTGATGTGSGGRDPAARFLPVRIESLSESERRITYDSPGA